jgi:hypothetical protein
MTVTNWTSTFINGKEFLVIEVAMFRIPMDWDPNSNMFIAVAAPDGGLGGFPAIVQGEPGETPNIDSAINITAVLDYDDTTPDAASWTEISENLYRYNTTQRRGPQGDAAAFNLEDADNLTGTPTAGQMIVADPAGTGFTYLTPKVGDEYWPATINNTPSGNAAYTLCAVSIPAQDFDWRPEVSGWCVITGTGPDVQVDLVARLNGAAAGNIVGRGRGHSGQNVEGFSTVLSSGPPPGSAGDYNRVAKGEPAVVYLRAERQSGANTFTTTDAATYFNVRVRPIP